MFKEIQHSIQENDLSVLQVAAKNIISLNKEIQDSQKIIKQIFINKNEKLLESSYNHLGNMIKELNNKRDNYFRKFGYVPQEFHFALKVNKNNLEVYPDNISFKNALYEIKTEDLQSVCDKMNMAVLPVESFKNSIKMSDEMMVAIKENSNIFILTSVKNLNLNNIINVDEDKTMLSLVPSKIATKWESFTFQLPVYRQISKNLAVLKGEVDGLKSSLTKMNENINKAFEKQEIINNKIINEMSVLFGEMNKAASYIHSDQELDRDKVVEQYDYNNPQYETHYHELDPYETDAGYTNYETVIPYTVTVYPIIKVKIYGERYQNKSMKMINNDVAKNVKTFFSLDAEKIENVCNQSFDKAYMLMKRNKDGIFQVLSAVEGVDVSLSMLIGSSIMLSSTNSLDKE